jgi:DNA-binding Lrp family transcriptional regulator
MIKAQDVIVALKLLKAAPELSFAELGKSVGLSASEAHGCVRRLIEARLVEPDSRRVIRRSLLRFLQHGVPFAFPASLRETTRGLPTAWGAPVLRDHFATDEAPPVWPDPEGTVRGQSVKPLYPSVVAAAQRDPELYDLLALVDALRLGRARERKLAEQELEKRLADNAS